MSPGGIRGDVTGWSAESRRRMVKTLEALPWDRLGRLAWIGLTYPAEYPEDGRIVKRQFDNWLNRWRRAFGQPVGAWKIEYQRRGAPHYHVLLTWPEGRSVEDLRQWVGATWYEVCGRISVDHLKAGTKCDVWRMEDSPAAYFAGYGQKASKEYQQAPRPGYVAPGRFWGLVGIRPQWSELAISADQFQQVKRICYGIRRSRINRRTGRRYAVRKSHGCCGTWAATGRRSGEDAIRIAVHVSEADPVGRGPQPPSRRWRGAPGPRPDHAERGAAADAGSGS